MVEYTNKAKFLILELWVTIIWMFQLKDWLFTKSMDSLEYWIGKFVTLWLLLIQFLLFQSLQAQLVNAIRPGPARDIDPSIH